MYRSIYNYGIIAAWGPALLLLCSCATNARFDSDRYSPAYYRGGSRIFVPYLGSSLRSMLDSGGGANNWGSKSAVKLNGRTVAEEDAAVGVILSGISLLINKGYYQSSYLTGNCVCHSQMDSLNLPCSNVLVALYDDEGKERGRILSEDGEFVFPVEKDKYYRIGIISKKYKLGRHTAQSLRMGDSVVLHLNPKPRVNPENQRGE